MISDSFVNQTGSKVNKVPNGSHPGYKHLPAKSGVYRCTLRTAKKRRPEHADYTGVLPIANGKARIYLWAHADGSLGLRMEKIVAKKETP